MGGAGGIDGVAVGGRTCWGTRDGRDSLEIELSVSDWIERTGPDDLLFYVPEDLEGDGVRLLDRVVGGIALVAHVLAFMPLGVSKQCA